MPKGSIPGHLLSATRQHAICAGNAAQGGEEFAIQSVRLETTTLSSSDAHLKQRNQFRSSIASAPSASAAPESFDVTHVTSSSMQSRGTISVTSSYYSKSAHVGFSTGGNTHVRVLPTEDLCNRSPGFGALVFREETPSPLPVGGPTNCLPKLTRQHCVMVTLGHGFVLRLAYGGGPSL